MKRDFISILDWTSEEIRSNLDFAVELKHKTEEGKCPQLLQGKTFGLFFQYFNPHVKYTNVSDMLIF